MPESGEPAYREAVSNDPAAVSPPPVKKRKNAAKRPRSAVKHKVAPALVGAHPTQGVRHARYLAICAVLYAVLLFGPVGLLELVNQMLDPDGSVTFDNLWIIAAATWVLSVLIAIPWFYLFDDNE